MKNLSLAIGFFRKRHYVMHSGRAKATDPLPTRSEGRHEKSIAIQLACDRLCSHN
jgi:hypothetical protein